MQRKGVHLAGLGVGAAIMLAGCGGSSNQRGPSGPPVPQTAATQPQNGDLTDYTASKGGFATKYPKDWKVVQGSDVLNLAPVNDDSGGKRGVDIDVPNIPFHLPGTVTLGAAADGYIKDGLKKDFTDVNIQSNEYTGFPDANAKRIRATGKDSKGDRVIETIVAVRHDQVYIICSETDPAGAAAGDQVVQAILKNWKWQ